MRFVALVLAAVWTWAGCKDDSVDVGAPADCGPRAAEVQAAEPELPPAPVPERDELAAYVLEAELAVDPLSRQARVGEPEDAARARYTEIASQIATEARAHGATAFPINAPDVAAAHLGIVLVAIAAHETGFALSLDGDNGNLEEQDAGQRLTTTCAAHLGGCDGGWSHGLWQVKAPPGHTRAYYLKIAAAIAARSLGESGGLCGYTGSCGVSSATRDIEAIYRARWAAAPWRQP